MFILLDTGPLGTLINPNPTRKTREIQLWMRTQLAKGIKMKVPEIADYEERRNLILENSTNAINNLDALKTSIGYIPLTTDMMLKAAELWADVRRLGLPTAPKEALDGDVILAAQAIDVPMNKRNDGPCLAHRQVDTLLPEYQPQTKIRLR